MLRKIVLASALVFGINASASDWDATPLIGIEGGGVIGHTPGSFTESNENGVSGGVKLGAESDEYRAYISGRLYDVGDLDYMQSVGLEVQYLIPLNDSMNVFLGGNGGWIRLNGNTGTESRGYFGGDVGVDLDINDKFGLEVGYRLSKIDDAGSKYGVQYISNISAALIFKLPN